ncbi:hypothetical protein [uncultured Tenacibaculum sp.]|uniref:hypothetical protein n=1 Tax=uncultured Tenacibaculum sp. TaxID=174713 RepID=UPI0026168ED4|nr:hypothetical protein [uncultured Tenacibaculum sp.]
MKNLLIIWLTSLLLMPPLHAHNDVVVYDSLTEHVDINDAHEEIHHQNDSEEDKDTEHHHHCTVVSFSAEYIPVNTDFKIVALFELKQEINFYQSPYNFSFLNGVFQPPKA